MIPSAILASSSKATVAIVGGSYVGLRLAGALVEALPQTHRVVVVEANSHFHHLFTFPRFAVLHRGGEEKALVPYANALNGAANGTILHAKALSLHQDPAHETKGILKLDRPGHDGKDTLSFDFIAIATGTRLQEPWSLSPTAAEGTEAKRQAVETLRRYQDAVKEARKIVIVGGGAVGVQVAFDIAELYANDPSKSVTIVHSRPHLMNKFHSDLHDLISQRFADKGVKTVLGSRVKMPASGFPLFTPGQTFDIELLNGNKVEADLVLTCTGQTPRSELLASYAPESITADGFIDVRPTMQIKPESSPLSNHIFSLGDIANSGAAKTVRAAMGQVDVIKNNILELIKQEQAQKESSKAATPDLNEFVPGPAGIHLSLGLYESIKFGNPQNPTDKPRNLGIERDLALDMGIENQWKKFNVPEGTPWHL
ncbi:FAD/NAD(P)-binding domain-containing protein [Testicularia cyperi]|uniref:FAD/NAD(P)-binding domain-containing protein n=1 Tax=Testicularia cyperi TaxID=1882483 RepID=A0A317XUM6_9BASI|nr:FAD/NAD(P)-binding domain-containing protein [Testicularia cyperi]